MSGDGLLQARALEISRSLLEIVSFPFCIGRQCEGGRAEGRGREGGAGRELERRLREGENLSVAAALGCFGLFDISQTRIESRRMCASVRGGGAGWG